MLAAEATESLAVFPIVVKVLCGLGLFLFGMEVMTDAVKAVAGGGMKALLARITRNRFKAAFTGAFTTAVIQSSSVTTVLVVGFISAGLLTLQQSVGIILGANVGTTVTAQIIAFKVVKLAYLMVALGYLVRLVAKNERLRLSASAVLGLGLIFLGMNMMSEATHPLRDYAPFLDTMKRMDNPVWAILFGMLFTALVQSSSATTGIVIVLASNGYITLEAGIALALGANIGTCVTAILASLGKPRAAQQAAMVHVVFNVIGVAIWIAFIGPLADLVRCLSSGMPRQIANAHTIFNVANTMLFIWFTGPLARLVRRIVPERHEVGDEALRLKYLDPVFLQTPALAFRGLRREIHRMGGLTQHMLRASIPAVLRGGPKDLEEVDAMGRDVDTLYEGIAEFAGGLSRQELTSAQSQRLSTFLSTMNHVEHVSETIRINLLALAQERIDRDIQVSDVTLEMLDPLRRQVIEAFDVAMEAFEAPAPDLAPRVLAMKDDINRLATAAKRHLALRLTVDLPNRQWTFRLESDIVENLKRLYYFSKRIAKAVLDAEGGTTKRSPPSRAA